MKQALASGNKHETYKRRTNRTGLKRDNSVTLVGLLRVERIVGDLGLTQRIVIARLSTTRITNATIVRVNAGTAGRCGAVVELEREEFVVVVGDVGHLQHVVTNERHGLVQPRLARRARLVHSSTHSSTMFASIRFAARCVATRRQFSNIPSSGATAADAAAASIAAASLVHKDTSRKAKQASNAPSAKPNDATSAAATTVTKSAGAMSHGQRRELNDMVSKVAGASQTVAMYDAAPDAQRMNLNEESMRIVIGALAKLGRADDVVCCVTECLFHGNV